MSATDLRKCDLCRREIRNPSWGSVDRDLCKKCSKRVLSAMTTNELDIIINRAAVMGEEIDSGSQ